MSRISTDDYYLNIAKAVSMRSSCLKRQYGCVIVNNKEIIATGYNGSPRGESNCCDTGICERMNEAHNTGKYDLCKSVHAEQNALLSASRKNMIGATLYLWGGENGKEIDSQPCPICQRMIQNAGIAKVICSKGDQKMNNETIHEYKIKLRGDGVYDLYIDKVWVVSRGSYENILEELRKLMIGESHD